MTTQVFAQRQLSISEPTSQRLMSMVMPPEASSSEPVDLRETSILASLLALEDGELMSARVATEEGCKLPLSNADTRSVQHLYKMIIAKPETLEDELNAQKRYRWALSLYKNVTRYFLVMPSNEDGGDGKDLPEASCDESQLRPKASFQLPIHVAASVGNDVAVGSLIYADKGCSLIGDRNGAVALHHAVFNGHLNTTKLICGSMPSCASVLDAKGSLPLHYAVGSASNYPDSPQITSILVSTFPSSLRTVDSDGLLPLHIATKHGFTPGVRAILACHIDSVYERAQSSGMLALDFAIQGHITCELELKNLDVNMQQSLSSNQQISECDHAKSKEKRVKTLLEQRKHFQECIMILLMSSYYKRAVLMPQDCPLFLPLHASICARLHPKSWDHILELYGANHGSDVDTDGQTPLHCLLRTSLSPDSPKIDDMALVKIIGQLHALDRLVALRLDCMGCLPLHVAVLEDAGAEVVKAVLDCGTMAAVARWQS